MKHADAALVELERATVLDPGDARMAYVYAVALHSTGKPGEAIAKLEKALAVHPYDRNILEALVSFHASRGEGAAAKKYAVRLQALSESDNQP
jgi:Flp pilus assembly protein TadD